MPDEANELKERARVFIGIPAGQEDTPLKTIISGRMLIGWLSNFTSQELSASLQRVKELEGKLEAAEAVIDRYDTKLDICSVCKQVESYFIHSPNTGHHGHAFTLSAAREYRKKYPKQIDGKSLAK